MSLLDRRNFLTGALYATGFASLTLSYDMGQKPNEEANKNGLYNYLADQHPEVMPETLIAIAGEFDDFKLSPIRPYVGGAAAAGTYGYLEYMSGDDNKNKFTEKLTGALGMSLLGDDFLGAVFSGAPEYNEALSKVTRHGRDLNEEQIKGITNSVITHVHERTYGTPALPPALLTMVTKEHVENQLDRQDVNHQDPGGPNGPE